MTTIVDDWIRPSDRLPEEGQKVWIMDSGGHVQPMKYSRGLWFMDSGMYIYYTPTFWYPREAA